VQDTKEMSKTSDKIIKNLNMSVIFISGGNLISGIIFINLGNKQDSNMLIIAGAVLFAAAIAFFFVAQRMKRKYLIAKMKSEINK